MSGEHDNLQAWAVFRNPADAPGQYIVRRFDGEMPTAEMYAAPSLKAAREFIPTGLVCFVRNDWDVLSLVETWI